MAIKIYELFAPFANPADGDYPYGSLKNDSIPGAEDGTPLDAKWGNDYAGFDAELFARAGTIPSGQPDKLGTSQRMDALLNVFAESSGSRSFKSFGVTGLGMADDYAALQDAIDWAGSAPNRRVFGRVGDKYRISAGLVLKWDGKFSDISSKAILDFTGTTIVPDANNIVSLKGSRNYAEIWNPSVSNEAAKTGVTAYALAPEDEAQVSTKVSQMFCKVFNPFASGCATAFRFKPGPTTVDGNSGSYYHDVYNPTFQNCVKGFYFQRSVSGDNLTTRVNIYSPKHLSGHCAFDMEAVDSLVVWGGSSEFINQSGEHAGNPTLKVHKPVPADTLSSSNIKFVNYTGEVGTTPFDFSQASEQISMPGCTFFAYENEGLNNVYALQNMQQNEGAIVSRAKYSSNSTPLIGVRRDVGTNQGQAYLTIPKSAGEEAVFYSDMGFTFGSQVDKMSAYDIQNTSSNVQIIGSSGGRVVVTGSLADGTVNMYNSSGLDGRGFEFGGVFYIGPETDNTVTAGKASKRYSVVYAGTGSINTSDANEKTSPLAINDEILDAWGDVSFISFQWLTSIKEKGEDAARWHFGVIAQQLRDAFLNRDIDATKFGLLCFDKWDDQFEPVMTSEVFETEIEETDERGKKYKRVILQTREVPTGESKLVLEAGERWGIRPDQCLFLEAAYQRRRSDRIESRLNDLESR